MHSSISACPTPETLLTDPLMERSGQQVQQAGLFGVGFTDMERPFQRDLEEAFLIRPFQLYTAFNAAILVFIDTVFICVGFICFVAIFDLSEKHA